MIRWCRELVGDWIVKYEKEKNGPDIGKTSHHDCRTSARINNARSHQIQLTKYNQMMDINGTKISVDTARSHQIQLTKYNQMMDINGTKISVEDVTIITEIEQEINK